MKKLTQESWSPGQDFNLGPPIQNRSAGHSTVISGLIMRTYMTISIVHNVITA
jgi:hypothetical protein